MAAPERRLDLQPDVLADRVPELAGQGASLTADGGDELLALPAQLADLVAGEPQLGAPERLAEREQLLDLVGAVPDRAR